MFVNYDGLVKSPSTGRGFGSSERKACENFVRDIGEVERMLKAEDKINKKQTFESLNPGAVDPFLPTN